MSDISLTGGGNPGAPESALIKDTTTQTFAADVLDASRNALVLVDFWAPWCGPCKQLTPVLEKVVNAAKGSVLLVKMNIDEHPDIAAQLNVQSIPAVFAFQNGRPVDKFMGALPESQLISFIERIIGKDAFAGNDSHLEAAEALLDDGNFAAAGEIFASLIAEQPDHADALAGLAMCYIKTNDLEHASETLARVPQDKTGVAKVASAKALLDLALRAGDGVDVRQLMGAIEANPSDHQSRFELAIAFNAQGENTRAADELLEIMRRDRNWNEEAARIQLVQFFEAWGPSDGATIEGRKQLSSLLFS